MYLIKSFITAEPQFNVVTGRIEARVLSNHGRPGALQHHPKSNISIKLMLC